MVSGHRRYALFIGRWQPFHNGHKYIIDKSLKAGKNVCIAIRDTELSESNPFTVEQRAEMIRRVYGDRVRIVILPDIESVNIGRNVGYDIVKYDVPASVSKVSATNIRAGKDTNLPDEIAEYIKSLRTTLWLTGLPCSGKSTLGKRLKEELDNKGFKTVHFDADDVRGKLNADLGFSERDRMENLRRISHVAKLFNDNGIFVIASFVSPENKMRQMIKSIITNIKLCYVKCDQKICEKRDVKGMYKKARQGLIKDFTGVSAPFEVPQGADVIVDTGKYSIEECVKKILDKMGIK
ncbi:MAG: adenylyl-sulfate kinase [Candidatus Omnitrophica bacterium]|nr:adenylyl-sulfate kinase [Candidatus Omnitrophota bacterium]